MCFLKKNIQNENEKRIKGERKGEIMEGDIKGRDDGFQEMGEHGIGERKWEMKWERSTNYSKAAICGFLLLLD